MSESNNETNNNLYVEEPNEFETEKKEKTEKTENSEKNKQDENFENKFSYEKKIIENKIDYKTKKILKETAKNVENFENTPLIIKNKRDLKDVEKNEKIKKLKQMRNDLENKLESLDLSIKLIQSENDFKQNKKKRPNSLEEYEKTQRAQFFVENIKKERKNFENELHIKIEKIEKLKKKKKEIDLQIKTEKSEKKKNEISFRLETSKEKKEEKLKILKKNQKKFKEILKKYKKEKPLFELIEEEYENLFINPENEKKKKKLEELRERVKPFEKKDFLEHLNKYKSIKNEKEETRKKKIEENLILMKTNYGESHRLVEEELKKIDMRKELYEKRKNYCKSIEKPMISEEKADQLRKSLITETSHIEDLKKNRKYMFGLGKNRLSLSNKAELVENYYKQPEEKIISKVKTREIGMENLRFSKEIGKKSKIKNNSTNGNLEKNLIESKMAEEEKVHLPKIDTKINYLKELRRNSNENKINWEKYLNYEKIPRKDIFDFCLVKTEQLDKLANRKETHYKIQKRNKNIEDKNAIENYYINSIKGKLAMLKEI